jgi:hypothetical protein
MIDGQGVDRGVLADDSGHPDSIVRLAERGGTLFGCAQVFIAAPKRRILTNEKMHSRRPSGR